MELPDMLQAMNAQIKIATFVLFAFNFARGADCMQKQDKYIEKAYEIAKTDPTEKHITAEYCLYFDTQNDGCILFDGWKLLLYEQFIPSIFMIQARSYDNSSSISANLDADIKFSANFGSVSSACVARNQKGLYKCRVDVNEEYNIYERFDTLHSEQKIDTAQIVTLFDKVFLIKWNLEFKIDYQPHKLSGSYNIKISGMCNKEQLKKIAESKKNEKNKSSN
jgi:hypothetical protein